MESLNGLDLIFNHNHILDQDGLEHKAYNKERKNTTQDIVRDSIFLAFPKNKGGDDRILNEALGMLIIGIFLLLIVLLHDFFFHGGFFLIGLYAHLAVKKRMDLCKEIKDRCSIQSDTEFLPLVKTTKMILLDIDTSWKLAKRHVLIKKLPVLIRDMVREFKKDRIQNILAIHILYLLYTLQHLNRRIL